MRIYAPPRELSLITENKAFNLTGIHLLAEGGMSFEPYPIWPSSGNRKS